MIEAHTISWTGARAASLRMTYRRVLAVALAVDVLLGLYVLFHPASLAIFLDQPDPFPEAWPRVWGAVMIGVSIIWLSGRRHPAFYRWPNWGGIATKLLLALVFLLEGKGFRLLAGWESISGVVLLVLYYRFLMAEMGRRP